MDSNNLLQAVVSLPEAARRLGDCITTQAIRKEIVRGNLPGRKLYLGESLHGQGVWIVALEDVLRMWPNGPRKRGRKPNAETFQEQDD